MNGDTEIMIVIGLIILLFTGILCFAGVYEERHESNYEKCIDSCHYGKDGKIEEECKVNCKSLSKCEEDRK